MLDSLKKISKHSFRKSVTFLGVTALLAVFLLPVNASDSAKTVHAGESIMVQAACETLDQVNVFAAMLADGSNVSQARVYLWSTCPIFDSPQQAIITEVLQTIEAHQRRWFIIRLFLFQRGGEYFSFWSTPLDQRNV